MPGGKTEHEERVVAGERGWHQSGAVPAAHTNSPETAECTEVSAGTCSVFTTASTTAMVEELLLFIYDHLSGNDVKTDRFQSQLENLEAATACRAIQ